MTKIERGTTDPLTEEQEQLLMSIRGLQELLRDWEGEIEDMVYYFPEGHQHEGFAYEVTADIEDVKAMIKYVTKQNDRFHSVVKY